MFGLLYNKSMTTKKLLIFMNKNKKNFFINQTFFIVFLLVSVSVISALSVMYSSYKGLNFLPSDYLQDQVSAEVIDPAMLARLEKLRQDFLLYESCIRENMAQIAPAGSQGVVVDSVSFVGDNRALIFYHDQEKRLISEVVLSKKDDGQPQIAKNYLKVANGYDYSQGVYGADPN